MSVGHSVTPRAWRAAARGRSPCAFARHRGTTPLASRPAETSHLVTSGCDGPTRSVLLSDAHASGTPFFRMLPGDGRITPPRCAGVLLDLRRLCASHVASDHSSGNPGLPEAFSGVRRRRAARSGGTIACSTRYAASALTSRSTAPTTHTTMQPHAQTTDPVIKRDDEQTESRSPRAPASRPARRSYLNRGATATVSARSVGALRKDVEPKLDEPNWTD